MLAGAALSLCPESWHGSDLLRQGLEWASQGGRAWRGGSPGEAAAVQFKALAPFQRRGLLSAPTRREEGRRMARAPSSLPLARHLEAILSSLDGCAESQAREVAEGPVGTEHLRHAFCPRTEPRPGQESPHCQRQIVLLQNILQKPLETLLPALRPRGRRRCQQSVC